jgi:hypothetical protein
LAFLILGRHYHSSHLHLSTTATTPYHLPSFETDGKPKDGTIPSRADIMANRFQGPPTLPPRHAVDVRIITRPSEQSPDREVEHIDEVLVQPGRGTASIIEIDMVNPENPEVRAAEPSASPEPGAPRRV